MRPHETARTTLGDAPDRHDAATQLEHALDEAAADQRFLYTRSRPLLEAARSEISAGTVSEVYPRTFAKAAYLAALSARGQAHHLIRTLAKRHPSWTFCLYSAAVIHGLQVPFALLDTVHVRAMRRQNRRATMPYIARHLLPSCDTAIVNDVRVTEIDATVFDCLRYASFRQGLAIADSALHHNLTTLSRLTDYAQEHGRGRHGAAKALHTLGYTDARSTNGGESSVRGAIIELGFLIPEIQIEVPDPVNPNVTKTVDFYWRLSDGRTVIFELDGLQKYRFDTQGAAFTLAETQRTLADERRRESHLNLTGATVVRMAYAEAIDDQKLTQMLTLAGIPKRQ